MIRSVLLAGFNELPRLRSSLSVRKFTLNVEDITTKLSQARLDIVGVGSKTQQRILKAVAYDAYRVLTSSAPNIDIASRVAAANLFRYVETLIK